MGSPINVAKETTSRLAQVHGRVGWDKRRIAAPAHHSSSISPLGGPALDASLSRPTKTSLAPFGVSQPGVRFDLLVRVWPFKEQFFQLSVNNFDSR